MVDQSQYNEWFGKRLQELMDEKGLSVNALSSLCDIGRMTISRILRGRYATAEELKKLADALAIRVERLKRKDVEYTPAHFARNQSISDLAALVQEAEHCIRIALGVTEKGLAYQMLGAIYFSAGHYPNAAAAYQQSLRFLRGHANKDAVFLAYESVIQTAFVSEDMHALEAALGEAEQQFCQNDTRHKRFLQLKADMLAQQKRYAEAVAIYQVLGTHYAQAGLSHEHLQTLLKQGECHLYMGKFAAALQMFEHWYERVAAAPDLQVAAPRYLLQYARAMFAAGEAERAISFVETRLADLAACADMKLRGHYSFLLALLKKDSSYARHVMACAGDKDLKLLAAVILYLAGEAPDGAAQMFKQFSEQLPFEYNIITRPE